MSYHEQRRKKDSPEAEAVENLHLLTKYNEDDPKFGLDIENFDIFNEYNNVDVAVVYCDRKKLDSATIQARIFQDYVEVHETLTFVRDPLISDHIADDIYERDVTHFARRKPCRFGEHIGTKGTEDIGRFQNDPYSHLSYQETFITSVEATIFKSDANPIKIKTKVMKKDQARQKFEASIKYKEEESVLLLEDGNITRRESDQLVFSLGKIGKNDKIVVDFAYMTRAAPFHEREPDSAGPRLNWNMGMDYGFNLDLSGFALNEFELKDIFGDRNAPKPESLPPMRPNAFKEVIENKKLNICFQIPDHINIISWSDIMEGSMICELGNGNSFYSITPTDPNTINFGLNYNCKYLKRFSKKVTGSSDNRILEDMIKVEAFKTPDNLYEANIVCGIRRNMALVQFFNTQTDDILKNREYIILIDQCMPQIASIKFAVKMMLQSLEIGSIFNIITVGDPSESIQYSKQSVALTEENFPSVIEFIDDIQFIKTEMKDITTALTSIIVDSKHYKFQSGEDSKRQMFLFSDGRQNYKKVMDNKARKILTGSEQKSTRSTRNRRDTDIKAEHDPCNRFFYIGLGKSPNADFVKEYAGRPCDLRGAWVYEKTSESLTDAALRMLNFAQMKIIPNPSWERKDISISWIDGNGRKETMKDKNRQTDYTSTSNFIDCRDQDPFHRGEPNAEAMIQEYISYSKAFKAKYLDSSYKVRVEIKFFIPGLNKTYKHVMEAPVIPLSHDTMGYRRHTVIALRNELKKFGSSNDEQAKRRENLSLKLGILTPYTSFYGVREGAIDEEEKLPVKEMKIGFGNPRGQRCLFSTDELVDLAPDKYEVERLAPKAGHMGIGPPTRIEPVGDDLNGNVSKDLTAFNIRGEETAQGQLEVVENLSLRTDIPFKITNAGKINGCVPYTDETEEIFRQVLPNYTRDYFKGGELNAVDDDILSTIIAILILRLHFNPEKDCWDMFIKKSKKFLKTKNTKSEMAEIQKRLFTLYNDQYPTKSSDSDEDSKASDPSGDSTS